MMVAFSAAEPGANTASNSSQITAARVMFAGFLITCEQRPAIPRVLSGSACICTLVLAAVQLVAGLTSQLQQLDLQASPALQARMKHMFLEGTACLGVLL